MNAVFVGFNNFLSHKTNAVVTINLGFYYGYNFFAWPQLLFADAFTTIKSDFQTQAAKLHYHIHSDNIDIRFAS